MLFCNIFFRKNSVQIFIYFQTKLFKHGQAISYIWSMSQQPCFYWCSHYYVFILLFWLLQITAKLFRSSNVTCMTCWSCDLAHNWVQYTISFCTRYGNDCGSVNLGQICCVGSNISLKCMTFSGVRFSYAFHSWLFTICILLAKIQKPMELHTKLTSCSRC